MIFILILFYFNPLRPPKDLQKNISTGLRHGFYFKALRPANKLQNNNQQSSLGNGWLLEKNISKGLTPFSILHFSEGGVRQKLIQPSAY